MKILMKAMSALDKLLRSNELNFAFLAFVPTLMISYTISGYISSLLFSAQMQRKRMSQVQEILL